MRIEEPQQRVEPSEIFDEADMSSALENNSQPEILV
jgi:hypothetical protein